MNASRPRVVIVDDEPDFLRLLESWLKPLYDVESVDEPEDLCRRILARDPDLVVLDVHMPEIDGFAACRELRAARPDLAVFFLTGSKTDEDYLLHLEAGGSRYLTKPISRRQLLDAVAGQLGGPKVG